jgi:ADP-heptose:LPS heptosyltransferase
MKITLSSLFFYNKSLSVEFVDRLLPSLHSHLETYPSDEVRVVFTDNSPASEGVLEAIQEQLKKVSPNPRLNFENSRNSGNQGFGGSHNLVFEKDTSDVFVLLNNDVFFAKIDWLSVLVQPFHNKQADISGLKNAPRLLLESGNGTWAKSSSDLGDYVEGSVLAFRTSVVKKYGLFAEDLPWAYFEDADLILRYRQMGYKIASVEIPHEHRRSSSMQVVSKATLLSIREQNRSRFLARWSGYLRHRKFTNHILLDLRTDGWGDVIAALPSLFRILQDHPTATVQVLLENAGLQDYFKMHRVVVKVEKRSDSSRIDESAYDRLFKLSEVDFTSPLYLGAQVAATLGVNFDIREARAHFRKTLSSSFPASIKKDSKIAVLHCELQREKWEGRGVSSKTFLPAVKYLQSEGYFVVLVGAEEVSAGSPEEILHKACDLSLVRKTNLYELGSLISFASLYVGIDSGPLHLAQLLGVSTFAIFGATLPSARLLVEEGHTGFVHKELECLGCYHLKRGDAYNYCIRRDQACVKKLDSDQVLKALQEHLAGVSKTPRYPVALERKIYSLKIEPTLRIRSVIEEYRFKELCLAMFSKFKKMFSDQIRVLLGKKQ